MARIATTLLVLALLGGTAAAFAVTEGLKLEKSPILSTRVTKEFSPTCGCPTRVATISFRLRKADRLRLQIVRGDAVVRTLVDGRRYNHGFHHFAWNGRDDSARLVPQGVYKPRVHLQGQHRTIVLPNPIQVDTTRPQAAIVSIRPEHPVSSVTVRYRLSEQAHAILLVDGRAVVFTRRETPAGTLQYRTQGAFPKSFRLQVAAQDLAGNVSAPTKPVVVSARFIQLARHEIAVKAGTRFGVRVQTDAAQFSWRLGSRSGMARPGLLVLRAPPRAGRLELFVAAHGAVDRAVVTVRPRR